MQDKKKAKLILVSLPVISSWQFRSWNKFVYRRVVTTQSREEAVGGGCRVKSALR
jgi:hypothetical protein